MKTIENKTYDEERALYGEQNVKIKSCSFEGPADGESALKEASDLDIENCRFLLRYPLWHVDRARLKGCEMTETCRAALWYDTDIAIEKSLLGGIKALRECKSICLADSAVNSTEFGWFCDGLNIKNSKINSEYPFLKCKNLTFEKSELSAKYSFQYAENVVIRSSVLNTKDAFWHGKNITVYDSVIKGEYLGWYSDSLKLVNCEIIGTQPLCYATNLVLENCTMTDCDLSFEKSEVIANVNGEIDGVKNPKKGKIKAGAIKELILDDPACKCEIIID